MRIDVRFDARAAIAQISAFETGLREKAIARALNRTATTVRAVGARAIAAELKPLKVSEVRKAISIRRATAATLTALVKAGGRQRIPLTAFNARQNGKGVRVRVGGRTYDIPHAFINQVRGARPGVRIRAGSFRGQFVSAVEFRSKRVARGGLDYPIAEIFAPGVPAVFVQARIMQAMRKVALERFAVVIAQEVNFLNSRG